MIFISMSADANINPRQAAAVLEAELASGDDSYLAGFALRGFTVGGKDLIETTLIWHPQTGTVGRLSTSCAFSQTRSGTRATPTNMSLAPVVRKKKGDFVFVCSSNRLMAARPDHARMWAALPHLAMPGEAPRLPCAGNQ